MLKRPEMGQFYRLIQSGQLYDSFPATDEETSKGDCSTVESFVADCHR